jgi:hypothetical protein
MFTKSFTGKTWMTNNGMKHLCLDEEQQEGRGQATLYRQVENNSVVAAVWRNGKYENEFFLATRCHPDLALLRLFISVQKDLGIFRHLC